MRTAQWTAAAMTMVAAQCALAQATFQAIGSLGQPFSVNNDGASIVGRSPSYNPNHWDEAARWVAGNPTGIGFLTGTDDSVAFGVSGNGSVIVGASGPGLYDMGYAFKWSNGVMTNLGRLTGGTDYSIANAVSQDGNVIVGESDTATYFSMAWRKVGNGPLQAIGPMPNGTDCWALDVSANGSVIVGATYNSLDTLEAFSWTSTWGMTPLPMTPGSIESNAFGISANGAVIVGTGYDGFEERPVRWVNSTPLAIPVPATYTGGAAYAASGDGSVIVGNFWLDSVFPEAMIWDAVNGSRRLQTVLTSRGATIPFGWTLTYAWDISSDGRVIVGNAVDDQGETQAFVATLYGAPVRGGTCGTADFNGDGDFGTDADIEAFFACLAGNCCSTCFPGGQDFNGDGDSGTDADIEAFFRVLAGNNC